MNDKQILKYALLNSASYRALSNAFGGKGIPMAVSNFVTGLPPVAGMTYAPATQLNLTAE